MLKTDEPHSARHEKQKHGTVVEECNIAVIEMPASIIILRYSITLPLHTSYFISQSYSILELITTPHGHFAIVKAVMRPYTRLLLTDWFRQDNCAVRVNLKTNIDFLGLLR